MSKIEGISAETVDEAGEYRRLQVPSGWIYTHYRLDRNAMTSVFVPFTSGEVVLRKDVEELVKEASIQIKNFGCDGSHASHGCDACLFQRTLAKFTTKQEEK